MCKFTTVQNLLHKRLRFYAGKIQIRQQSKPTNHPMRTEFARNFLNKIDDKPNFLKKVLFTDVATFHINGSVHPYNFVFGDRNSLTKFTSVMVCPYSLTEDGFEMQFGTNHLGHFLFTCLLLPRIISSAPARIITVSSLAHTRGKIDFNDLMWKERSYSAIQAYQQSKLANVLFSKELARRLGDKNVTTYSLHPGVVKTELGRHIDSVYFKGLRQLASTLGYFFYKNVEQGAQTTLYCALEESIASQTGLYYSDCAVKEPSALAKDEDLAKRLWEESAKLTGVDWDPFSAADKGTVK